MGTFETLRDTLWLRAFTFVKIPLIAWLEPIVEELTDERCEVRFPLSRRSKNHLGAMYFGALAAGADVAAGMMAMRRIQASGRAVQFVFKEFHAEFLRRAEGDVHFVCDEGARIHDLVDRAIASGERVEQAVDVVATVPTRGPEPVGRFQLTLSLKRKS